MWPSLISSDTAHISLISKKSHPTTEWNVSALVPVPRACYMLQLSLPEQHVRTVSTHLNGRSLIQIRTPDKVSTQLCQLIKTNTPAADGSCSLQRLNLQTDQRQARNPLNSHFMSPDSQAFTSKLAHTSSSPFLCRFGLNWNQTQTLCSSLLSALHSKQIPQLGLLWCFQLNPKTSHLYWPF